MKIGGNVTLYSSVYMQNDGITNSFTNGGTIDILGDIKNGTNEYASGVCTFTNNGTIIRSNSYNDSGNTIITGTSGKMVTAIENVSVTDLATTITAGTSFDKAVVVGDDSKYSATVKYFVGDTEDTNTNAGYNKTYTAKIIVTPVIGETNGYAFRAKPTATLNGASCSDSDVTLNSDGTVTISYTYPATAKAKMTGIKTPTAIIGLPNGTAKDAASLGLPTTVTITIEDGDKDAPVSNLASGTYTDNQTVILSCATPGAEIYYTNGWNSFWDTVTLGYFFKNTKEVTISGSDGESGVLKTEYLLSDTELTETVAKLLSDDKWTVYNGAFSITANNKKIIYAKVTDNEGNITIVNSAGVVVYTDAAQSTTGITHVKGVDGDQTAEVTLKGNTIKSITDGSKTLTAGSDYTVAADGTDNNESPETTTIALTVRNPKLLSITEPEAMIQKFWKNRHLQ